MAEVDDQMVGAWFSSERVACMFLKKFCPTRMLYAVTRKPIETVDDVIYFGRRYIVVAKTADDLIERIDAFFLAFPRDRFAFIEIAAVSGTSEIYGLFAERQKTIFAKDDVVPSTKSALNKGKV